MSGGLPSPVVEKWHARPEIVFYRGYSAGCAAELNRVPFTIGFV
jgi:hypothetical protein